MATMLTSLDSPPRSGLHAPAASGPRPVPAPARASRPVVLRDSAELGVLRRMAAGDERALAELHDRWARSVHAAVLRLVGDPEAAEEIVEATFWQAWQQASRYEPARGAVSTWLITIGRSRALDLLRSRRRSREDLFVSTRALAEVAAPACDPALQAEAHERRRFVRLALSDLPPEQRQVLELSYFAGLSQSEIADRTGLPLGTVKTRSRLAMRKMRAKLEICA